MERWEKRYYLTSIDLRSRDWFSLNVQKRVGNVRHLPGRCFMDKRRDREKWGFRSVFFTCDKRVPIDFTEWRLTLFPFVQRVRTLYTPKSYTEYGAAFGNLYELVDRISKLTRVHGTGLTWKRSASMLFVPLETKKIPCLFDFYGS